MFKRGVLAGGVPILLMGVAGCDEAPPPATVILNTPPADGGPVVLLTVMVAAAFVLAAVAVICGWGWATERRARREADDARRDAEEAVIALTGRPLRGARLVVERRPDVAGQPLGRGSVARWSE